MSDEVLEEYIKQYIEHQKVPVVSFVWQGGEPAMLGIDYFRKAIELGMTHIDTAELYGNEAEIGKAISGHDRGRLFITSKVQPGNLSYENVIMAAEGTLQRLGTGYLDLYLIHWPNRKADMKSAVQGFKKLMDDGKIRAFGVSNFTINHLKDTIETAKQAGLRISNNQVEYHPGLNQQELLDFCKKHDIAVTGYSPLKRGKLAGDGRLKDIADKYGKSPAQVSLRWMIDKGMIVIPKSSSEAHLKENLDVLDFQLGEDEIKAIDSLGDSDRMIMPGWADFDY